MFSVFLSTGLINKGGTSDKKLAVTQISKKVVGSSEWRNGGDQRKPYVNGKLRKKE